MVLFPMYVSLQLVRVWPTVKTDYLEEVTLIRISLNHLVIMKRPCQPLWPVCRDVSTWLWTSQPGQGYSLKEGECEGAVEIAVHVTATGSRGCWVGQNWHG